MALEIEWTKRADKKFDTILAYLNRQWGEGVTGNFVKKVYDFLDILAEYPEIGTMEHKQKGVRGFTIIKHVGVFYKVRRNIIDADPLFLNEPDYTTFPTTEGDFHLFTASPCLDQGFNDSVSVTNDLENETRIQNGIVDMGLPSPMNPLPNTP